VTPNRLTSLNSLFKTTNPVLTQAEFGCEAQFMAAHPATSTKAEVVDGQIYKVYRLVAGADAIEIDRPARSNIPKYARYFEGGNLKMAIRYDLYQTGLPNNPSLFRLPPGIAVVEAKLNPK
jgi:hypothetical protein